MTIGAGNELPSFYCTEGRNRVQQDEDTAGRTGNRRTRDVVVATTLGL